MTYTNLIGEILTYANNNKSSYSKQYFSITLYIGKQLHKRNGIETDQSLI